MSSKLLVAVAVCTLPLALPAASFHSVTVPASYAFMIASTSPGGFEVERADRLMTRMPNYTPGAANASDFRGVAFTLGAMASADQNEYVSPAAPDAPEPGSLFLLGSGLLGGAVLLRRKSRQTTAPSNAPPSLLVNGCNWTPGRTRLNGCRDCL